MKRKSIPYIAQAIILILCFMACAPEAKSEGCLSYEPAQVTLNGTIVEKIFPGPPEFESIEKGDRPDTHWILKLSEPVCVNGDPKDEINSETETNIKAIQLIVQEDDNQYKHLLSRKVVVTGTLFHAHTGYHRTRVLMEVISLRPAKDEGKK
jgi:hypothetical protein